MIRPLAFASVIILGWLLRKQGIFGEKEQKAVSWLVLHVTLPAAVIHSFYGVEISGSMYMMVLAGFLCSVGAFLISWLITGGRRQEERMFLMLNCTGYNIGCFALPVIQGFFGAAAGVAACMFDIGNAVMMTGGAYALTSALLGIKAQGEAPVPVWKRFLTSIPFDTYLLMLILAVAGILIPEGLDVYLAPAAQANSFLAMLMLGLLMKPLESRDGLGLLAGAVGLRLVYAAVSALLIVCFLPVEEEARQVLAVTVFAPVSALAPVYTEKFGGDGALAGFATSVTIVIGLAVMSGVAYFL